jgi:hypothetical protein
MQDKKRRSQFYLFLPWMLFLICLLFILRTSHEGTWAGGALYLLRDALGWLFTMALYTVWMRFM